MAEEVSKTGKYLVIVLTGLVSLGVGVGSGLLLDLFRAQAPKLTYTTTSAEMFPGTNQKTGIVLLRVTNNGRREGRLLQDLPLRRRHTRTAGQRASQCGPAREGDPKCARSEV